MPNHSQIPLNAITLNLQLQLQGMGCAAGATNCVVSNALRWRHFQPSFTAIRYKVES